MKLHIFSFTENGKKIAYKISAFTESDEGRREMLPEYFAAREPIAFVSAVGIAVRYIAPFVKDKLTDPPVLVIDEQARFVIPILSGHAGGANELARRLAAELGSVPVVTTATDINGMIAVDELAAANHLMIKNRDNIKKVSGKLLKGRPVSIAFDEDVVITGDPGSVDDTILGFIYRPLIVGLGMRKDMAFDKLETYFLETLESLGKSAADVYAIASIDIKKEERALAELAEKYGIPLYFFTADELNKAEGGFESSAFVESVTGVGDVSARAAKALGKQGHFLLKKDKKDGMTISVFEKLKRITFEY